MRGLVLPVFLAGCGAGTAIGIDDGPAGVREEGEATGGEGEEGREEDGEREGEEGSVDASCRELYDLCLDLGVSEETCGAALDECLAAQEDDACEDAFWRCIEAGFDLGVCVDEYVACSGG